MTGGWWLVIGERRQSPPATSHQAPATPWPPSCNPHSLMSVPVQRGEVGSRPSRGAFLTGEWSARHPAGLRPGGRFLSRGRVAIGALHWLGWIIISPRSVVSGGGYPEVEGPRGWGLPLVGRASIPLVLVAPLHGAPPPQQDRPQTPSA